MAFCVPGPWAPDCISDGIKTIVGGAITEFIKSMYEGAVAIVAQVSTFWMNNPSPDVDNGAVLSLRADMSWYVAAFAVLGFLVGLIKLVMSQDVKNSLIGLATPIVNLILATTAYATGIGLLLTASDQFSLWIVERATGGDVDLTQMIHTASGLLANPGPAFLMFMLLLIGAIVNLLFMYFRDVMFLILSAFIVVLAAASGSEQGRQAWRKANGWLVALLLFKPVAAGIYSLGFRMLVDGNGAEEGNANLPEALQASIIALLILILASLALPALIKFIVPAAGVGAGAFSGGAAIGAGVTLAAGAAVLAGTGGAAAAGKGAATMPQGASNTASTAAAGEGANSAAATGSSSPGGDSGAGAGASDGGSGASEAISGGGASASGTSSGESGSGAGSGSGSSSTGGSTGSTGSGSSSSGSTGSADTGSTSPGASAGTAGAGSSDGSASSGSGASPSGAGTGGSGNTTQSSSSPQENAPSTGGPSGAKAPNKLNEAMQKMGDVKGLANGANPSKLVDEDGE